MLSSTADEVLATTRTVRGVTSHPPGRLAEAMISVRPGAAQVGSEGHGVLPCRRTAARSLLLLLPYSGGPGAEAAGGRPAISRRPDLRVMGVHPAVTSRLRSTTDHALLARRVAAKTLVRRRGGSDLAAPLRWARASEQQPTTPRGRGAGTTLLAIPVLIPQRHRLPEVSSATSLSMSAGASPRLLLTKAALWRAR